MSRVTSPRSSLLGCVAAALLVPAGLAAQQPPDHNHADPSAAPDPAAPGMMEGMAERMQAMHEMMQQMHQMMMGMHGGQGGHGMMGGMQGQGMQGQGMQGQGMAMGGRGMAGADAAPQPCTATVDQRLAMLLAGPVGQLALSSTQWTDLVAVLEHARTEALAKLTPEQQEQLSTCR